MRCLSPPTPSHASLFTLRQPGKTDLSAYPVVHCVSLREVLVDALHLSHINFFSLDVEGAELEVLAAARPRLWRTHSPQVLRSFPFEHVQLDVIVVECGA